ncbi:hypothetical protein [Tateyamaria sp. SN3-11]|uniref:hypothetical protein n=1 Tax=Tateyamaria sp. SN3-11 TaxID=3092147 RepID=UPI0039EAB612
MKLSEVPRNTAAYCCTHVFHDQRPLSFIMRDDDDDLIVSCGGSDHGGSEDWVMVGIGHFDGKDGVRFEDVPDLPQNRRAIRNPDTGRWVLENDGSHGNES